jgi:DNA repair exonuclease SbcCD ATPase subunit
MDETTGKVEGETNTNGEIDTLKSENDTLRNELKTASDKIAGLEKSLVEKDGEIEAVKQLLEESKTALEETKASLLGAAESYKELATQANPGPVAGMIKGETIEEIKESVETARALVEKVKQEIGAENTLLKVPAGAPQRTAPDLSTLSPREKIKYGMEA